MWPAHFSLTQRSITFSFLYLFLDTGQKPKLAFLHTLGFSPAPRSTPSGSSIARPNRFLESVVFSLHLLISLLRAAPVIYSPPVLFFLSHSHKIVLELKKTEERKRYDFFSSCFQMW